MNYAIDLAFFKSSFVTIKSWDHIFTSSHDGVIDTEAVFSAWAPMKLEKKICGHDFQSTYKKQGKKVNTGGEPHDYPAFTAEQTTTTA